MLDVVRAYIEKNNLLTKDRLVLVGVSGGADSIALLTVLVKLGYSCFALHCNFHLRGEESMRDEHFTEEYVHSLKIPYSKVDFETQQYADYHHLSIEMAARELRYEWFEKKRIEMNAQAIAIAHHQNDNVETFLLNLIRGTGIRGLCGIRPKNGYIVRPLLAVSKSDIIEWLSSQNISYITDSTNFSDAYTRNFIRLRILPLLEKINPSVRTAILCTSDNLSSVSSIYEYFIQDAKRLVMESEDKISIGKLLQLPSSDTILYELLKPYGFSAAISNKIWSSLKGESGKIFYSRNYKVLKDREYLFLLEIKEDLIQEYSLNIQDNCWKGPISLSFTITDYIKDFQISRDKQVATFDYDKLSFPLVLRKWKDGDWFIPFGMKGKKKLSDYFSDHKFSLFDKERTWLLCSNNQIIWIVGERIDNRFIIGKMTKKILVMNFLR
ncbi:MAG: tRNA lysidine(34) synthetase TilS [Bacteroidaceae bacterium]|nr:tRNA lysidine(34) synthetase TilS [Bacteroidaceae bacterium]